MPTWAARLSESCSRFGFHHPFIVNSPVVDEEFKKGGGGMGGGREGEREGWGGRERWRGEGRGGGGRVG